MHYVSVCPHVCIQLRFLIGVNDQGYTELDPNLAYAQRTVHYKHDVIQVNMCAKYMHVCSNLHILARIHTYTEKSISDSPQEWRSDDIYLRKVTSHT
jgi:hypothetical protein